MSKFPPLFPKGCELVRLGLQQSEMEFLTQGNWGHQRIEESKGLSSNAKTQGRRVKPEGMSERLLKLHENEWPKLEVTIKSDIPKGIYDQRDKNRLNQLEARKERGIHKKHAGLTYKSGLSTGHAV